MTLNYRELQKELKELRTNGNHINCRLNDEFSILKAEYDRLHPVDDVVAEVSSENVISIDNPDDSIECQLQPTPIKVFETRNNDTVVLGIGGEYRIIPCYWDDATDSAISINKEVAVTGVSEIGRNNDVCKIEIIGDEHGSYRAFPVTSIEGRCDWLHPDTSTRYYQVKAKISTLDSHSSCVNVASEGQKPDLVTSDTICICRCYDDKVFNITRYFPSIATFQRVGGRWFLVDRSHGVKWLSTIQSVRQNYLKVGTKVFLQSDIGSTLKPDLHRIDKLYYANLCLMAICTNERSGLAAIVPMVQLQLPQTKE